MKHYKLSSEQGGAMKYTDLFEVATADFSVGFSNKSVALTTLTRGDVVDGAFIEVPTLITGPTLAPTAQVKIVTDAKAITPLCAVKTVHGVVSDNTVVGAAYVQSATDTLAMDLQLGGGDGAVAATGNLRIWVRIIRKAIRDTVQG